MTTDTARVFVVHLPTGRDDNGRVVPTMNLTPAADFGEVLFILPASHNPFSDPAATMSLILAFLEHEGFSDKDYLLLVGNPILIGYTCIAAASFVSETLRVLQWNRASRTYLPVILQLPDVDYPRDGD